MSRAVVSAGRRVMGAGVLALGLAAALHSQTPPQDPQSTSPRPVFRAGANFVAVDAYVTHDGKVVDDLTAEDFEVAEDGKKQHVEEFRFVRGLDGPDAEPIPTKLEAATQLVGDPHRRVFVLFLSGYHATIEGAANTRPGTTELFQHAVATSDLFGVLRLYEPVTDLVLGERPDILIDEANSYWDWTSLPHPKGQARMPAEEHLYSCLFQMRGGIDAEERMADLWRARRILQSLEELTVRLASMRETRSNVLVFGGAIPLPLFTGAGRGGLMVAPGGDSDCQRELAGADIASLSAIVENIVKTAQRGNVSISFIEPAGLSIFDQDMSATQGKTVRHVTGAYDNVHSVALMTGGTAVVAATEMGRALDQIIDAQSGHYEMGYYSSNNKFDGKYRAIGVKVRRPGVSVVARKGYQAPTTEMLRASEAAAARAGTPPPPPSPAAVAIAELARVRPDASLYAHAGRRADTVQVVAEISSAQIDLGHWRDGASIEVHLLGPGNAETASGRGQIAAGARSASVVLPFANSAGPWTASIRVTGAGGDLTDRIDVPVDRAPLLGDPLIYRASTLPNATFSPVADFMFRRTERIRVEWPVLTSLDHREARLLDARGQPLAVNASAMEVGEGSARMLVADVSLVALAPADYVVEVTAGTGANTARRLVAFRIVR